MKSIHYVFFAMLLLFCSCAKIEIHREGASKRKSSFKVYPPKPYLLVERNLSPKVQVKSTIIYLPDYENPIYIKSKSGIGSTNLTFNQENGYLASFGAVVDSKVPEILTSITSIIPLLPDAQGAVEGLDKPLVQIYEMIMDENGIRFQEVDISELPSK